MTSLPNEVKELIGEVPVVMFSTASLGGQPNTCIVGIKEVIDDETIYLSDQFFKKTLANVKENEKVSLVIWQNHTAYQIYGTARYVCDGPEFEAQRTKADAILAAMGTPVKVKGGIFVQVDEVYDSAAGPHAGEQIA